ncbi:MAG: UDP-3-O-(3-hydroxymyristoyl)glucosamine N-acyltransferase [Raineya sp.]
MQFTVQQIAQILGGEIEGDDQAFITNLGKIQEAQKGDIAFLANPKYEHFIYSTQATAVIVSKDFQPKQAISATLIRVPDAYLAFSKLLATYEQMFVLAKKGIETPSFIHETATIGQELYIGAFSYIGEKAKIGNYSKIYPNTYIAENVVIGENTIIYAGVKIYKNCTIGSNCIIHAGAVIGSDGFGFAPQTDGSFQAIPQIGNVVIEDNVSIGANTTIDRATMGSTLIKKGAKIDNLVQIAHNVVVGENTVIAAQAGIAGSTEIGNNCMLGGQVGLAGHIKIANGTILGAQSGLGGNIEEEGQQLQGSPAFAVKDFYKTYAVFKKLPELYKQINALERKLQNLKEE